MGASLHIAGASGREEGRGAVGWILDRLLTLRSRNVTGKRELQLLETLSLGGRRQLMLVECGNQRYLVGVGTECVETIVAVIGQPFIPAQAKDGATF
jgi:flagellar biogenesis protein FliO